jgi:flotillin
VAAENAALREAELVAEVVKPAQAEAERIKTLAKAQAEATKLSAGAAAAEGRIALDQLVISQLPEMLRAAAEGLNGANLTVLNGAEGLNGTVASLAGQGLAILRSITEALPGERGPGVVAPVDDVIDEEYDEDEDDEGTDGEPASR